LYLAQDTQPTGKWREDSQVLGKQRRSPARSFSTRSANLPQRCGTRIFCPVFRRGRNPGNSIHHDGLYRRRPLHDLWSRAKKLQPERKWRPWCEKIAWEWQKPMLIAVIHRDLKPANIMDCANGEPVVMELRPCAPRLDPRVARPRQSGVIMGTPAYMSPEQTEGNPKKIRPRGGHL